MAVTKRPPHLLPGQNKALRSQILLDSPLELWRSEIAQRGVFSAEKLAALAVVLGIIFSQVSFVTGPATASDPSPSVGNGPAAVSTARVEVPMAAEKLDLPMAFERNQGQTDPTVDFLARGRGYQVFLTGGDAVLAVGNDDDGFAVRMDLSGASGEPELVSLDQQPGVVNYFLGDDPAAWATKVPTFGAVEYRDVYSGIDLRYYGNDRQLEYDFIVQPGADPNQIALLFDGSTGVAIAKTGDLEIGLNPGRTVTFSAPIAYQRIDGQQVPVASSYDLTNDVVSFTLGDFDPTVPLIIDPTLEYGSFLGGTLADSGTSLEVDSSGNIVVAGYSESSDFPATVGAYDTSVNGANDVFVAKLNSTGTTLQWATYIGGSALDNGVGVALDSTDAVYVGVYTASSDFPTTGGAFDSDLSGSYDGAVAKLSADGSTLVYSTYLGGSGNNDYLRAIAVDASGQAIVGGSTDSSNYPTIGGSYDTSFGGSFDAFVTKVNTTGTGLVWSTFIGGTGSDGVDDLVVDGGGTVYLTGQAAVGFPTTAGAYDSSVSGTFDGHASKLSADGSTLTYATVFGGSGSESGTAIAVADANNLYIAGDTPSSDFPTTAGAHDTTKSSGDDIFTLKFDLTQTGPDQLAYSTFIGGAGYDRAPGIAVDASGRAHIAGWTQSSGLATAGAYDTTLGGTSDTLLAILSPDGATMEELTYVGGDSGESTGDLLLANGAIWLTGNTSSATGFPITGDAYDSSLEGSSDGFLVRFATLPAPQITFPGAVWRRNGQSTPLYNPWDGSAFGVPQSSQSIGEFRIIQAAEAPTRDEAIVLGMTDAGTVAGEMWNGTAWSALPFNDLVTGRVAWNWGLATAYESLSGDGIIVWNNGTTGTTGLSYRVWNGTAFSAAQTITTPLSGEPVHLMMAASPRSDGMTLVVSNSAGEDYAIVWDGSTWGNSLTLDASGSDSFDIDVAYEQLSGTAVVVDSHGADSVVRRWNGTVWSGAETITQPGGMSGNPRWNRLAGDPTSNNIALGVRTYNDDVWLAAHDGSSWTTIAAATSTPSGNHPGVDVAFEGTSGVAIAAYGVSGNSVAYRTWTSGGGWSAQNVGPDVGAVPNSLALFADLASDEMMLATNDSAGDINMTLWNGSAWATPTELETTSGLDDYQPFFFLWDGVAGSPPATSTISGTVFEDIVGDVLNDGTIDDANNPGTENVDVYLYLDDGDANLDAGDTLIGAAPTQTDVNGDYSFTGLADGDYFVVVDSKTVAPSQDPIAVSGDIWAEQTYGPIGGYCDNGVAYSVRVSAGPCYGGIAGHLSDDFSQWDDREHRAELTVGGGDISNVDFGFSFNVVTNTVGGNSVDYDLGANRTVQGSLRQFIQNASAIAGTNAMRFVPAESAAVTDGSGNFWWRLMVTTALPTITGDGTTIDGTAFDFTDGATVLDTNAAQIGAGVAVGTDGTYTTPRLDPELEIRNFRPTTVLPTGLVFEADDAVLRHVSIWGFGDSAGTFDTNVRFGTTFSTDPDFTGSLVEFNVIGTGPASFTDPGVTDRSGQKNLAMRETDNAIVRDNLIGFAGGVGVSFSTASSSGTVLRNEIRHNGILKLDANPVGVWISGNVTGNLITDNSAGVYNGSTPSVRYEDNTITANGWGATHPHGIWVSGSSAIIRRNVIADNAGAGVMVQSNTSNTYITRNSIYSNGTANGQIGIDLLATGDDSLVAPYVTPNDSGDGDTGGNALLNYPVLDTAQIEGTDLIVTGWARPFVTIDLYIADPDPTGFGEGKTWLVSLVEDSAADTDGTFGTYGPGLVNGLDQGTDTTNRFSFTIPIASLAAPVVGGDSLTSLATSGTNTSEFGGNVTVPAPFVVNSTGDASDANAGNGVCETATSGQCTLRAAIEEANALAGTDSIEFNIPTSDTGYTASPVGFNIRPSTLLPAISTPMVLDASTQPEYATAGRPVIEVDGSNVSAGEENGFYLTGGGATVRGFVLNNWGDDAIDIEFNGGNTIVGNYVGTNVTGTAAAANAWGINFKTENNVIGGTTAADRNVVSGNTYDGFYIYTSSATGNVIQGNYIGTNATGTAAVPNGDNGLYVWNGATGNTIGGTVAGAGNVISGNVGNGIELTGIGTDSNTVVGNYLGTNAAGTAAIPNTAAGIELNGADGNQIGGTSGFAGNLISGNSSVGVWITGDSSANILEGNIIGLNALETVALPNARGITINSGAVGNTIGGTSGGAGNVLSGNSSEGILFSNATTTGNVVQGNYIGANSSGIPFGNLQEGISIIGGAFGNLIGGDAAGEGNLIANNDYGVAMTVTAGLSNTVLGNSIHSNTLLGIDLNFDGVTANDPGDGDSGPNDLLNFPVITSASEVGGTVTVDFDLDVPNGNYRIEFFTNTAADGTGNGEGEAWVSSVNVSVSGGVPSPGSHTFAGSAGDILTATATQGTNSPFDSTSEFSAAFTVTPGAFVVNSTGDGGDSNPGNGVCETATPGQCTLRAAIEEANAFGGTDTIEFNIPTSESGYAASPLSYTIQIGVPSTNPLPAITEPVTIDGTTQPDFPGTPIIVLDGTAMVSLDGNGLNLQAGNTTVRGLVIVNSSDDAIEIEIGNGNTIVGNYIGVGPDGVTAVANGWGISVKSDSNTIGGTLSADRNVISGNANYGISLYEAAASNIIQGNYIGTTAAGDAMLGNGDRGVFLQEAANNNTIGGTEAGAGNIISGNIDDGIFLQDVGTDDNIIRGNYIGTDITGLVDLGNTDRGVQIESGADGNTVGGTTVAARNVISGNGGDGVVIGDGVSPGTGTTGNVVAGNYIGVGADGTTPLGNDEHGVHITTVDGNTIGGDAIGAGNVIANNNWVGVIIQNSAATANAILRNSIYSNGGIGIDLGGSGVTENDGGDGDPGANDLLNFPVITEASEVSGTVTVDFGLDVPNGSYRVEFFTNTAADGTGNGEGETWVSAVDVSVTGGVSTPASHTFAGFTDDILTATATEGIALPFGSTSEFSAAFTVTTNLPPVATNDPPAGSYQVTEGGSVQWDVMGNDSDPNGDTLRLSSFTQPSIGTVTRFTNGTPADTSDDYLRYTAPVGPVGPTTFTYTISDGFLTDTATVFINVNAANNAPVFDQDLGDQIGAEASWISLTAAATDPDVGDTLTYSTTGLPLGLSIDSGTGLITGMVNYYAAASSPYSVEITVDDGNGGTDTDTFTWTVTNVPTMPPYVVAGSGGANGGNDLLTRVNPVDVDPVTNEVDIGIGTGTNLTEAIAIQPSTGVLFAVDGGQLGTLDLDSGVFAPVGTGLGSADGNDGTVTLDNVVGLTFHPLFGRLFGVHTRAGDTDLLFAIDTTTGAVVPNYWFGGRDYVEIRALGALNDVTDIAIDPTSWQMYGVMNDGTPTGPVELVTIRRWNGRTRSVDPLARHLTGLSYNTAGQLWGVDEGAMYSVDKTDGSLGTPRPLDNGTLYGAIDFGIAPATPPALEGTVFEDIDGNLLAGTEVLEDVDNPGIGGVTVYLYSDDGSVPGEPDALDSFHGSTLTGPTGHFFFTEFPAGGQWIVVDSSTIAPTAGGSGWPEQTYGPVGAVSYNGSTYSVAGTAGALYGGMQPTVSDDASALLTSEHVAYHSFAPTEVLEEVDFGFSFNVVTNLEGGGASSPQGSLRQFMANANTMTGPNSMRFVPAVGTNGTNGTDDWWSLAVTAALPQLTDADTTIDGTAYSSADGATVLDTNTAQVGAGQTVGTDAATTTVRLDPELAIYNDRTTPVANGLDVQSDNAVLRNFAIHGFGTGGIDADLRIGDNGGGPVVDGVTVENVVVGTDPASNTNSGPDITPYVGVLIARSTNGVFRDSLVRAIDGYGFRIGLISTGWSITGNEFSGNGTNGSSSAFLLTTSGATISGNLLAANTADALIISADGQGTIDNNTIDLNGGHGVYVFSNALASTFSNNIITNNGGGIAMLDPVNQNRLSQNTFGGNGGISIDLGGAAADGVTANSGVPPACGYDVGVLGNDGIDAPVISSAAFNAGTTTITGTACAGAEVEIYRAVADSDASDTSGGTDYGEGVEYLSTVSADGITGAFSLVSVTLAEGEFVSAIAIDGSNNTSEFGVNAVVGAANNPPTAVAGGPYTIAEGEDLILDGSGSSDPDTDPLTYLWDVDNDGQYDDTTGPNPTVSWLTLVGLGIDDDGGPLTIGLQVDDSVSGTDSDTAQLTITNTAPDIIVTGTGNAVADTSYSVTVSVDEPGNDTVTDWTVSWGDGTHTSTTGPLGAVAHTYSAAGRYDVTVSVVDEDGYWSDADLFVPSWETARHLGRYDGSTGAFEAELAAATTVDTLGEVEIGPDGLLYVSSYINGRIARFDPSDNSFVDFFVTTGITGPLGIEFGPDGNLYVSDWDNSRVRRYNGTTRADMGTFATGSELNRPSGLTFGPDGNLYVASNFGVNAVVRYDGSTGAFIDVFTTVGGTSEPEDLEFGPDGNLYVAYSLADQIGRFDGLTGAFIDSFVPAGSGLLDEASGIEWGPDGNLYVSSRNTHEIKRYDGDDGTYLGNFVAASSGGLTGPLYATFLPDHLVRCDPAPDTTPPVITLVGADPQVIEVGSAYTELGGTALDDVDGDITGSIVINSSGVNTAVLGSYSVTYDVSDAAGNPAVQVTRTVDVVDTTAPLITLLGANPQIIEVGTAYSELGATAVDNYDGIISGSIVINASAVNTAVVGSYSVTYNVTDANGNPAVQVTRTVNVVDTGVPVVTLLGTNPVTVEVGSLYVDAGATAWDTGDGDLTGSIVTVNPVNNLVLGSYLVTYDVTDSQGNPAVQVTRTVDVVDTTVPVITLLGANPQTIEVGTAYSELGATAVDNYDGIISGSIVINSSAVNTAVVGSYSVTYDVTDANGNDAVQAVRTVDVVDTTLPVITLLGANPQVIEVGDAYSELGATASDNYDGDISGSIVIDAGSVNTSVVASYSVTYNVTDANGNAAAQVIRTVDVVDTTVPVITLLGTNPQVIEVGTAYSELGATASDNYDGDITGSIIINSSAVNTAVVGSYVVTYDVVDSSGNPTNGFRTVDVVDTTAPVITLLGSNPQTIEVGAAYTELGATAFDNYDGDITGSIVISSAAVNTAVIGSYSVTYDVTDSEGNPATQVIRTVDVVDSVAPIITLLGANPQIIEVGTAYSELGATAFDVGDGDITGSIVINSSAVNTAVVGSYSVTYDVTDSESNPAIQVVRTVDVVDTTLPVITLLGANPQVIEIGAVYSELGATASDNYDGDISGSIVINSSAVNTAVVGAYSVTCNVTDSEGNAAVQVTRTVDVVDTTLPVIALLGADPQVIEVGTAYTELGATASDNYDGDISGSIVIDSSAVNPAVVGSYSVTYDVTDANGNAATQVVRTVDVVDTTVPVITLLGVDPQVIEIDTAYSELGATASDAYDGDISGSIVINAVAVNTGVVGSYPVTYDVTDANGNAAVQVVRTVDVVDTTVPVITLLGANPQTIEVGTAYSELGATAFDNYDGDISGSIVIDSAAVNSAMVGSYSVTYDATDSEGNAAAQVVRTVDVVDTTVPVITLLGASPQTIEVGTAYSELGATASDNYDGDITGSIIINSSAVNTAVVGSYSVTYDATDSEGNAAAQVVRTVDVVDTTAPVITLLGANPQVIEVGTGYSELGATASDNYDGDITGLIVINSSAVNTAVIGSYSVTYDVTDSEGNAAAQVTRTVDVVDTAVPVITLLGANPQTIEVGTAYAELGATAFDIGDGDITGSIVVDSAAVNTAVVGSYTVTYDVTDSQGNDAVQVSRTVDVVDTTVPSITLLGADPQTIEVGTAYSELGATATDNHDGDISGSIVINSAAVNTAVVGSYAVTYDVTDSQGNAAVQVTRTVDVVDTTVPVITLLGANPQTIEVGTAYSELGATATDNYDGDISGSIVINSAAVNTAVVGTYAVTYDVTDSGGNAAIQVTRTVDVVDTTVPVITLLGANPQVIEVGTAYSELGATASDNYDGDISGSIVTNSAAVNTAVVGTYVVTYDVVDSSGNPASAFRTVDVVDTTPPVITLLGANPQIIEVGAAYGELGATAVDNYDGDLSGSIIVNSASVNTGVVGSYSVTYDVTDSEGNAAVQVTRTVDVVDTTAPIITLLGADPQSIAVTSPYVELGATATDNYDGDISGSIVIDSSAVNIWVVGSYPVTYDVVDSEGNPAAQVIRTVNVTNVAPTLGAVVDQTVDEGIAAAFTATASDPDPTDPLTFSLSGAPAGASIDPVSGAFTWTPSEAQGPNVFVFDVVVTDGGAPALTDSQTVTFTVTEVNAAPSIAAIGPQVVDEQAMLTFGVLASDSDLPANGLAYSLAGSPAGAGIDGAGVFSWTPSEAQGPGVYTFDVVVADDGSPALGAIQPVTVTVGEVNASPTVVNPGPQTVAEADVVSVFISAADSDVPVNSLTYAATGLPDGLSIDAFTGEIAGAVGYTANVASPFSTTVTVFDDGTPIRSTQVAFTWTVADTNRDPVAANDVAVVDEDTPQLLGVLANDSDPDADPVTVSSVGLPAHGSAAIGAGGITYAPDPNYFGPDSFIYTISDGRGGSDSATIDITVTAVNDAPVLSVPGSLGVDEGTAARFTAAATDTEGDTVVFSLVVAPAGSAIDPSTGAFSWVPTEAQGPGSFSFDVVATDDGVPALTSSRRVRIDVAEVNTAPLITNPGSQVSSENSTVSLAIAASDSDLPANSLTYAATGLPGGLSIDPATGVISGLLPYDAAAGSPYSVVVTARDNGAPSRSSQTRFSWSIVNTNRPPSAMDITVFAEAGLPTSLVLNGADPDGDVLSFSIAAAPTQGALTGGPRLYDYTPDVAAAGSDGFTFTVSDGQYQATGTVTVSITPNHPPIGGGDQYVVRRGGVVVVDAPGVLGNDSDPENQPITAALERRPAYGTADVQPDGRVVYSHLGGDGDLDRFTYVIHDGMRTSVPITVLIIIEENTAPVVVDDFLHLNEDASLVFHPLANDSDPNGEAILVADVLAPLNGSIDWSLDGAFIYRPNRDWNGVETITYRVTDGELSSVGVITLTVHPVNDPPSATGVDLVGDSGETLLIDLRPYVHDVDDDELGFILESPPIGSVAEVEPGVFELNLDGVVRDMAPLTFVVFDPHDEKATALVSITVKIPAELVGVPSLVSDDITGPPQSSGDPVQTDPLPGAPLVTGLRLMIGSVLDTFQALRIPFGILVLFVIASLFLGLSRKFAFSSAATILPLSGRKRVDIVMAQSHAGVPARTEPGTHQSVVHRFDPDETGIITTGARMMVRSEVWVEVETPEGDAWVDAEFITEQQSRAIFVDDLRPRELVSDLIERFYHNEDLLAVTGGHDLHVALYGPPVRFAASSLRRLLSGASVYWWWGPEGDTPRHQGTFAETVGESVAIAYRNQDSHPVDASLPIPVEFVNMHSLVVGNHELGEGWRVFFRYENDEPAIAALMREVAPNPASMHGEMALR